MKTKCKFKEGDVVEIVDIHERDAFHEDKDVLVGKRLILGKFVEYLFRPETRVLGRSTHGSFYLPNVGTSKDDTITVEIDELDKYVSIFLNRDTFAPHSVYYLVKLRKVGKLNPKRIRKYKND